MIQGICKYWHTIKITSFYHIFVITKLPLLIKNINHIIKKSHIYRRVFISPLTKTHPKKKKKGKKEKSELTHISLFWLLCVIREGYSGAKSHGGVVFSTSAVWFKSDGFQFPRQSPLSRPLHLRRLLPKSGDFRFSN